MNTSVNCGQIMKYVVIAIIHTLLFCMNILQKYKGQCEPLVAKIKLLC